MTDDASTTVAIVAEPLWRALWREELVDDPATEVVGEVDAARVATVVHDVLPDVVLLHTDAPGLDVVPLCAQLTADAPVTRVLLVEGSRPSPRDALYAGAAGAIAAADLAGRVADVVTRLARGEGFLTPEWAAALLHDDVADRLTATEREVLQRVTRGASTETVAALHEVPRRLVQQHATKALTKARRAGEEAVDAVRRN
jgi:two-component system response regulator DesR